MLIQYPNLRICGNSSLFFQITSYLYTELIVLLILKYMQLITHSLYLCNKNNILYLDLTDKIKVNIL